MDTLKDVWNFPMHYIAFAWWITVIIGLLSIRKELFSVIGKFFKWGSAFRKEQLRIRIRNIEWVHDNADRLIRYLVNDVVQIIIEGCWLLLLYAIFFMRAPSYRIFLPVFMFNAVSIIIGPALRIRTLIHDLRDYPESVERLKAKLALLEK